MDRLETASHIMSIRDMNIGGVHIVPDETTSTGFYQALKQWLARRNNPFKVKCRTIDGDLHVEKVR